MYNLSLTRFSLLVVDSDPCRITELLWQHVELAVLCRNSWVTAEKLI